MQQKLIVNKRPISARDQEKIDIIIVATCKYFNIDRSIMMMPGKLYTKIRRICFLLISKNTDLSHGHIAQLFNRDQAQATRGIEIIIVHKNIYASLSHEIKDIAAICNNFEPKLFEWVIQH